MTAKVFRLPDNDKARRLTNRETADTLAPVGVYVFQTVMKTPITPRFNRADDTLTVAEVEEAIEAFEEKHKYKPVQVGATRDLKKIKNMYRRNIDATWSISCGPSKLVVIDADQKDGGPEKIAAHFEKHGLPEGCVVVPTQSGGRHYYFSDPEGKFTNSAGLLKTNYGCDVRGRGGQCVAPGNIREDGKTYGTKKHLLALRDAIRDGTLPELPDHIVELIGTGGEASQSVEPSKERTALLKRSKEIEADLEKTAPRDFEDVDEELGILALLETDAPLKRKLMRDHGEVQDHSTHDLECCNMIRRHLGNKFDHHAARAVLTRFPSCSEEKKQTAHHIANIMAKAEQVKPYTEGKSFDAVADDDDETQSEIQDDKRTKLQAEIAALDSMVAQLQSDIALDEDGAAERLKACERLRKRTTKELGRIGTNTEREKARSGFVFARDYDNYKAPDELIENLIPAVGTTILVGDSNVGKTFALLEIVRCLETGDKFLGRNVDSCGALLITGEGHAGLGKRLAAMRKRWPGVDVAVHRDLPDFGADAGAALRKIKAILDEYETLRGRPVKFLALDNLLLMSGKLDANKGENANATLRPIQDFAHKHGISMVIAAHENRSGKESGSYAWKALCDNMLHLKKDHNVRVISYGKERDGGGENTLRFKLAVEILGENKWGNPVSSCVVENYAGPEMAAVQDDDEEVPPLKVPDRREDRVKMLLDVAREEAERAAVDEEPVSAVGLTAGTLRDTFNARRLQFSGLDGKPLTHLNREGVSRVLETAINEGGLACRQSRYFLED